MKTFVIEFTFLIFRDEVEVKAESEAKARKQFLKDYPGVEGNGRIVSCRVKGEKNKGTFQGRLEAARKIA